MLDYSLTEIAVKGILSASLGALIFLSHGFLVNRYLRNQNYMLLSVILPITAMTIVMAIMTNVWLSLGLIGALSIVRFRTPVKSSYELVLIFALVTTGVVSAISLKGAMLFASSVVLVAPAYIIIKKFVPGLILENSKSLDCQYELIVRISKKIELDNMSNALRESILSVDTVTDSENNITTNIVFRFSSHKDMVKAHSDFQDRSDLLSLNMNNVNSTAIF